jgi:hypothetical protein
MRRIPRTFIFIFWFSGKNIRDSIELPKALPVGRERAQEPSRAVAGDPLFPRWLFPMRQVGM